MKERLHPIKKDSWKSESVLGMMGLKSVRHSNASTSGSEKLGQKSGREGWEGNKSPKSCFKEVVVSSLISVLTSGDAFIAAASRVHVQTGLFISQQRHFLLQLRHPGSTVKDFSLSEVHFSF